MTGPPVNGDAYRRTLRYDSLLRPFKVTTHVPPVGSNAARDFLVQYGYDRDYGWLKATSYPGGELVGFDYDERGYHLGEVQLAADGTRGTRYRLVSVRGQVTTQDLGNGIVETAQLDDSTGLAIWASSTRQPGQAGTCETPTGTMQITALPLVRQMAYRYDQFLNLAWQQKTYYERDAATGSPLCSATGVPTSTAATEEFGYDDPT